MQSAFEIAGSSGGGLAPAYGAPPTVIWGPGEAGQAHQTDEWAEGVYELARRWCGA